MRASPHRRRASTLDDHRQRVLRALVFLEQRLDGRHTLESLARVANMSPFHFQRVFAGLVGESPARFLRRLRLERAAIELRDGEQSIARIARRSGYGETAPFTRSFQALFGETPSVARRRGERERTRPPQAPPCLRTWVRQSRADGQPCFEPIAPQRSPNPNRLAARLVQLPSLRVAFLRRGAGEDGAIDDFRKLGQFASRRGPGDDLMFVTLRHDDDAITRKRLQRVDRGVVIGPRRRGESELGVASLAGGWHALASAEGCPADALRVRSWLAHTAIRELAARRRAGPTIEVALDDPRETRRGPRLFDVLVPADKGARELPWYWRRGRPSPERSR